ncbi:MAG TPA: TonB-dependent receptor [Sphingomonas bacterium]|jgi:iron complex outermembrane receptor protein|uniref:TonB-dependent receptor n=1 Tax=Sphingomonas bacterium TaxID=1895847 RepID=A0A3D0WGK8_9SPHN|nr:TonB-dependent receptor [Sphingomonas bacterium]
MRTTFASLLLAATIFHAPAALAQSNDQAASAAMPNTQQAEPAPAEDGAPGDIIVTAQRRSESLQRVPVSLTAVSGDTIANRNLNDLTQVARAAPTLQVGIDNTFAVRGVGTLSFAGTIDSSVALAIDEVNLGRPLLNSPLLNDLQRVEVLNGPQGLLFGKNASAGLLNIVTTRPAIGEYSSVTNIEAAARETPGADRNAPSIIVRETVNIPVSANSALRVSGLYSYQEPGTTYVGRPNPGTRHDLNLRTYSIKGKYLLQADALELYVIGDYNENHGIAGIFDNTYRQIDPTSISTAAIAAEGLRPSPDNLKFGGEANQFRDIATGGAQARVAYTLGSGFEISNLFAWRFYDQDQSVDADYLSQNAFSQNATQGHYDQYSNEFRIALPAGNRLSGQVGLYYFKSVLDIARQLGGNNYLTGGAASGYPFCIGAVAVPGARPPVCAVSNVAQIGGDATYRLNTQSYAAFGQLTYDLTDALKVIAGGRVTRDEINLRLTQNQRNYFSALGGPRGSYSSDYDNTDFSWKLGAQYQATPTIMAYGFYGRGYKGPGFNDGFPTATADVVVREETSRTAEIGVKSSFLDRLLTVNVSAFHTKFDNFQVQSFNPTTVSFQVQNAASVTSKGIEATVILAPVTGLTLTGSASALRSKFDDFPGAQCYPTQATRGCSATVSTFNAAGLTLPAAPEFTSSLEVLYQFDAGGGVRPFVQGDWYHRSSIFYTVNQAPGTRVGGLDVFGASIGAKVGGVRVALFCKNCTNEIYPTAIGIDSGDANARNNRGQATPKLSYLQQFGLDSVRTIGLNLGFVF